MQVLIEGGKQAENWLKERGGWSGTERGNTSRYLKVVGSVYPDKQMLKKSKLCKEKKKEKKMKNTLKLNTHTQSYTFAFLIKMEHTHIPVIILVIRSSWRE